jgi:hypothetical protein
MSRGEPEPIAGRPGAVLLVPGYGQLPTAPLVVGLVLHALANGVTAPATGSCASLQSLGGA